MASKFTHAIRQAELERTLPLFPPGGRILEIGAGDGWQAKQLQQLGFDVSAVDVRNHAPEITQHFPVEVYDGDKLPFADHSFDAVYSSNVLEHIISFDRIQQELLRVVRPNGIAVHCVPSAVWRFWTTIGHPLYSARMIWRLLLERWNLPKQPPQQHRATTALREKKILTLLRLALVSPRHGEHGTFLGEHWLFSHHQWERRLSRNGWKVSSAIPSRIFYTGNELMGLRLNNRFRMHIAAILGSSSWIFLLQPASSTFKHK